MRKLLWVFGISNGFLLVLACLFRPGAGPDIFQTHVLYHLGYVVLTGAGVYVCYLGLSRQSCPFWFGIGAAAVNVVKAVVFHSQPLASWPGGDDGPGMVWAWIMMPATFWIGVSAVLVLVPLKSALGRANTRPA